MPSGDGAVWRAAGALGRAWRLHESALPPKARVLVAGALLEMKAVLLPWESLQTSEGGQLLGFLEALAGKAKRPASAAIDPGVQCKAGAPRVVSAAVLQVLPCAPSAACSKCCLCRIFSHLVRIKVL